MKKNILILVVFCLCNLTILAQNFKADISNISIPQLDWGLYLNLDKLQVQKNNIAPDGTGRVVAAADTQNGITVSVYIEKAAHRGDYKACRKFYWSKAKKSPLAKQKLKKYEKDSIAFVEHHTKKYKGNVVNYHSINAYLAYKGYWIDVHISKVKYKKKDKALFDEIINSIKIVNPKNRNISELFLCGIQAYYMKDYKLTIKMLESVLQSEKEKLTFDKIVWRLVVDNLGMAYSMSKKYDKAKQTFNYGIKLDSKYPTFYYNLACTFAELSDFTNALSNLEKAYARKANLIKGEKLPNPKTDSSFKKYHNTNEFKVFLKKYNL